jgi:hypothetical protein
VLYPVLPAPENRLNPVVIPVNTLSYDLLCVGDRFGHRIACGEHRFNLAVSCHDHLEHESLVVHLFWRILVTCIVVIVEVLFDNPYACGTVPSYNQVPDFMISAASFIDKGHSKWSIVDTSLLHSVDTKKAKKKRILDACATIGA